MRCFLVIGAALLAASASVYACGGKSNDAPIARVPDASIDEAVATPDAGTNARVGPCGPFDEPDAAAAICSRAEETRRWAAMLTQPIIPPFRAAGLDLRGPHGVGLTVGEAEQTLCARPGVAPDGGVSVVSWGENDDVTFHTGGRDNYGNITRFLVMTNGYTGAIDFTSEDRLHAYRIAIGHPITRDGAPLAIDWPSPSHLAVLDELLRAMTATFAPGLSLPTGAICAVWPSPPRRDCIIGSWGVITYVYYPSLGVSFSIADQSAPQPAASTPFRIDVYAPPMPCDEP